MSCLNLFIQYDKLNYRVGHKYVLQAIERSKSRTEETEPSALERLLKRDPNPSRAVIMAIDMLMGGIDTVRPKYSRKIQIEGQ